MSCQYNIRHCQYNIRQSPQTPESLLTTTTPSPPPRTMSATQKPRPVAHGQPVQGQPDHGYAGGPPLGGARPGETVPRFVGTGKWSNALFDCGLPGKCDDATCAVATFCPWSLHGATAKMMRTGHRADACNGLDTRECAISAGLYVGGKLLRTSADWCELV